jgi:hypothetical protein
MEEVQPDGSSNESKKVVLTILAASSATALKMHGADGAGVTEDRGVVVLQETSADVANKETPGPSIKHSVSNVEARQRTDLYV